MWSSIFQLYNNVFTIIMTSLVIINIALSINYFLAPCLNTSNSTKIISHFLSAHSPSGRTETKSQKSVAVYVCLGCVRDPLPHPPPVLSVQWRDHLGPVQESVPRDLSLYDCSSTVTQCTMLFSLQRDVPQGIPPYTGTR